MLAPGFFLTVLPSLPSLVLFETNTTHDTFRIICGSLAPFPVRQIFSWCLDPDPALEIEAGKDRECWLESHFGGPLPGGSDSVVEAQGIVPRYFCCMQWFRVRSQIPCIRGLSCLFQEWEAYETVSPWEWIPRLHVCSMHKLIWHWQSASTCYIQICDQSAPKEQNMFSALPKMKS